MKQYLDLLRRILDEGEEQIDRTGTGTISVMGHQMRFDLQQGFPLVTTKNTHLRSIIGELLWMIKGDTNTQWLRDHGVTIWDEWSDEHGNLGPVYGMQWRDHVGCRRSEIRNGMAPVVHTDQLARAIELIRKDPGSRRIIIDSWNVSELQDMALTPCHMTFQFRVSHGRLDCHLLQRSADCFLGVPFNIAFYSMLTMMVAQITDLRPGTFVWTGVDCHLYKDHLDKAKLQISREPRPLPQMILTPGHTSIDNWSMEEEEKGEVDGIPFHRLGDFKLLNYHPHKGIKARVSV